MTATRMMDLGEISIGFEQQSAPVTNTFSASRGPDGTVGIAFCSEWAQAGASHSTDGALVLSRADAEALAAVLAPREACEASRVVTINGRVKQFDLVNRRWVFEDKPPSNTRLDEIMLQVAQMIAASDENAVRAALMAKGWLPPERLEAIAASWDDAPYISGSGHAVGTRLRAEFKGAPL